MKNKLNSTGLILLLFLFSTYGYSENPSGSMLDHNEWTTLLGKYVNTEGMVDYSGFVKEKSQLDSYLELLGENKPDDSWGKNEALSYWINLYNAFTVDLITRNYPLKSIMDIKNAWDIKFIQIGQNKYSLNEIEHDIIRKEFNEPRIHFALVCAAVSCPPLRNEAFVADKLEKQLQEQTTRFINDTDKNKLQSNSAQVSQIFNWFKEDFTKKGSLQEYLNKYSKVQLNTKAKIDYLDYSWVLNDQK